MFAHDLPGFDQVIANSALAQDDFWRLELKDMVPVQVDFMYFRAKQAGYFEEAKRMILLLQQAVMRKDTMAMIDRKDYVVLCHRVPDPIFTVDDLVDGLNLMTEVRQNAVLLALECKLDPEVVINMKWQDELQLPTTACVKMLLQSQAAYRHVKLPYVFWEWSGGKASPLISLKADAEAAFGKSWPAIMGSYQGMLMISPVADASHYKKLLDELQMLNGPTK